MATPNQWTSVSYEHVNKNSARDDTQQKHEATAQLRPQHDLRQQHADLSPATALPLQPGDTPHTCGAWIPQSRIFLETS